MTPFLASMAPPLVQSQYVKIHSLHDRTDLNDRTGTLGAWQQHTHRYLVYVDSVCYALKVCNLYCVPESWVAEVRGRPFRKQIDVMASKFHAPGPCPCPRSVLQVYRHIMVGQAPLANKCNHGGARMCSATFANKWIRRARQMGG